MVKKVLYGFSDIRRTDKEITAKVDTQVSELDTAEVDIANINASIATMTANDVTHDARLDTVEPEVTIHGTRLAEMDAELQRLASWHPTGEAPPANPKDFALLANEQDGNSGNFQKTCFCNGWVILPYQDGAVGKLEVSFDTGKTWNTFTGTDYGKTNIDNFKVYVGGDCIFVAAMSTTDSTVSVFKHYRTDSDWASYQSVFEDLAFGNLVSSSLGHSNELIVSTQTVPMKVYFDTGTDVDLSPNLASSGITQTTFFDVVKHGKYLTARCYDPANAATTTTIVHSEDGGQTWADISTKYPFAAKALTLYGSGNNIVATATGLGVWVSRDNGKTWFNGDVNNDRLNGTTAPIRVKNRAKVIVANYADGVLVLSYNNGRSWFEFDTKTITGFSETPSSVYMLSIDDDHIALAADNYKVIYLKLINTGYGAGNNDNAGNSGPQESFVIVSADKAHRVELKFDDAGNFIAVRGDKITKLMGTSGELVAAGTVKGHITVS